MNRRLFLSVCILIFYFIIEVYIYHSIIDLLSDDKAILLFSIIYISLFLAGIYGIFLLSKSWAIRDGSRLPVTNNLIGFAFVLIVTKLVFFTILFLGDLTKLGIFCFLNIWPYFQNFATNIISLTSKSRTYVLISAGIACIPFVFMMYGITCGKYNYKVTKLNLHFKDLPGSFNGFRIVQISDLHSGSFDDLEAVKKGFEMVQDQNPDIILFTGDLVNAHKDEINPYMEFMKGLFAPFGKFSVLGNHDYYGAYAIRSKEDRNVYWQDFLDKYESMGFQMLNNTYRYIEKGSHKICLVGVENWGAGRWFPKYGDLDLALEGTNGADFRLLLSHDPTHWEEKVLNHEDHIHLTLSGHTHGMQFGINIPGFKWSPVKYRYKRWMGLYDELGQYLYVNRGFGFLAFPGRVGMWPEIAVIELNTEK